VQELEEGRSLRELVQALPVTAARCGARATDALELDGRLGEVLVAHRWQVEQATLVLTP
jgi:hypothetical protein